MKSRKRETSKLEEGRVVMVTWDDAALNLQPGEGLVETYDVGIITQLNKKYVELSQSWNEWGAMLGKWTTIPLSIIKRVKVIKK